jgi:hypothetical protein
MSDRHGNQDGDWAAFPAVYDGPEGRPGPVLFTLDVDAEQFAVRQAAEGGWTYEWLTGPNDGYGFTASGPLALSTEEHQDAVRAFLGMIDPATGYIADE